MKRFFYFILTITLFGEILFLVLIFIASHQEDFLVCESQTASLQEIIQKEPRSSTITILAVGDIMLNRGVEYMVKKYGDGDFKFPFLKIVEDLIKHDILFGNLESVISDKGAKMGSIYSFRAGTQAIEGLVFAGFDILSVANNHVFDYGRLAMEDSFKRLKEAGIDYVGGGFNKREVVAGITKEIRGTKITFLAYTNKGTRYWEAIESRSGIGWLDERIKDDIEKSKEKSDVVIISFHFGEEYQIKPSKEQRYFAKIAIDAGADLVIGHHPHIIQPVEKYQNGWIVYSLGNFVFDQYFSKETMRGLLLEIIIKDKKIKSVNPKEIKISEFYQPYFSPNP